MLYVEIRTQNRFVGRIEIRNLMMARKGKTRYFVRYVMPEDMMIEMEVLHRREDGAMALLAIIAKNLRKEMNKFFSIPEDKVVNGSIKDGDIPQRYAKAFGKFIGIHTGTLIDGEMATYVSDIEGWLRMMKNGVRPLWD